MASNRDRPRLGVGDLVTVRVDLEKDTVAFFANGDTPLIAWFGRSRNTEIPHGAYHFAIEPFGAGYAVTIASFE